MREIKTGMILSFEDFSYRYPAMDTWALQEVALTLHPGESLLVAGTSGSGKSTLCRASVGLVPHFHRGHMKGRVLLDGLDTREHPVYELFRHGGLVFQNPDAQLFNHTVEAELAYGLESLGLPPQEIEKRLAWVEERIGLESLMGKPPHTLSGGEKQRVALGAILALKPRLLLLDEPFTHLDAEGAEELRGILRKIKSEGTAIVVIEHRLHEIVTDVDRLVVLHQGRVVADGPPHQVLSGDISPYGLNTPPLIRLFRSLGWSETPLSVDEALRKWKPENHRSPFLFDLPEHIPNPPDSPCPPSDPIAEAKDLWFGYNDQPALRGIDLKLFKGECVALIGRNGSGKTTLIKHLIGLLKPLRGSLKVFGQETRRRSVSELARRVGLAWQNPNDQLFRTTVRDEVLTGPKALRAYDPLWCDKLFERFGLNPLLHRSPFSLSEGQKKRVAFASSLAVQPELIVFDEPTAGQDDPSRREIASFIQELRGESRTILLVTHDLEFAAEHASRWLVLDEGLIIADASPDAVMADTALMAKAGLRPTQRFQLRQALKNAYPEVKGETLIP